MPNDSQFPTAWAVPLDAAGGHDHTLDPPELRHSLGALLTPAAVNAYGHATGCLPGGQTGAGKNNDLIVLASTGLTISVNSGVSVVARDGGGPYVLPMTGSVNRTHGTADATSPRIDLVVHRVFEPGRDGAIGTLPKTNDIVIIPGVAASNPVAPAALARDNVLAEVLVKAGATTITTADITDRRQFVAARGGIRIRWDGDTRPGYAEGEYADNVTTNQLERWSGTKWEPVASPASWIPFTPGLWSAAGAVNLGSGGKAKGRYQLLGKNLRVAYYFLAVRPCDLGYGSLYTRLPAGLYAATTEGSDFHGRAQLNTRPPGGAYLQWIGDSGIYGGDNKIYPAFNKTITDNTFAPWRTASSQGQAGTGIPLLSNEYPDPLSGMSINIELEVA